MFLVPGFEQFAASNAGDETSHENILTNADKYCDYVRAEFVHHRGTGGLSYECVWRGADSDSGKMLGTS